MEAFSPRAARAPFKNFALVQMRLFCMCQSHIVLSVYRVKKVQKYILKVNVIHTLKKYWSWNPEA